MPIQPTTYQPTPFLSEIVEGKVIPEGKLAYFRARLSNRLHELVLSTFLKCEKQYQLSRADLAKRVGRKPEQITRWFASPGNWEIDTVSDLLLGMGFEPDLALINLRDAAWPTASEELAQLPSFASLRAANDSEPKPQEGLVVPTQDTSTSQPQPALASASGYR